MGARPLSRRGRRIASSPGKRLAFYPQAVAAGAPAALRRITARAAGKCCNALHLHPSLPIEDHSQQLSPVTLRGPMKTGQIYVARQPIVNREGELVAYELLFRSTEENASEVEDDLYA